jgi:hypothetical protein
MKCRLCDRPTAGTGKLCADCARALQRARGTALSRLTPGAAAAAETRRARPITLTVSAPAATAPRANRPFIWVAAAGLLAIALVYFVSGELGTPSSLVAPAPSRPPPSLTEHVNVEPSPVVTRVEEPSWTAVRDADAPPAPAATTAVQAPVTASGAKTGARARGAGQDAKSMGPPLPSEFDVAAPKPAEADSQQQLAGVKLAAPAQPLDGAQVLASAMQKCGSEGGFSKFICEQKTYYAYCEDKWDKDPKCMRRVAER